MMNDFDLLVTLRNKSILPYYGFSQNAVSLLFLKYIRTKVYAYPFNKALFEGIVLLLCQPDRTCFP